MHVPGLVCVLRQQIDKIIISPFIPLSSFFSLCCHSSSYSSIFRSCTGIFLIRNLYRAETQEKEPTHRKWIKITRQKWKNLIDLGVFLWCFFIPKYWLIKPFRAPFSITMEKKPINRHMLSELIGYTFSLYPIQKISFIFFFFSRTAIFFYLILSSNKSFFY